MGRAIMAGGIALAVLAIPAGGAAAPKALREPVEYPHAGIIVATPVEFEPQALAAPFDVVRAVVMEGNRAVRAVTLSAFPVAPKVKADDFADAKVLELKKNLAIRNLKLLKKTPIPVAGVSGTARMMSYTFRGAKTVAAQVFFMRNAKSAKVRICYLLTVVTSEDRQAKLLPVLGAVIKSVKLTTVRHPAIAPGAKLGDPIVAYKLGFAIRRPRGWYGTKSMTGAEMGQVDYLLGGIPMPMAQLWVMRPSAEATTSAACAKKHLGMAQALAADRKQTCEVVSEGPVKLGSVGAYQFVLKQAPKKGAAPPPRGAAGPKAVIIVQRTACVAPNPGDQPKAYVLILTCQGQDAKPPTQLMETIAGSFVLLAATSKPSTAPATRPAGVTAPAAAKRAPK